MKLKTLLLIVALAVMSGAFCQFPSISLTFSALDSTAWAKLDSVRVVNRTWNIDTVLYYPDTVLVIVVRPVGVPQNQDIRDDFRTFITSSGASQDHTTLSLYIPGKDEVKLLVTDMAGRQVVHTNRILEKGPHLFSFSPGSESAYLFTAIWKGRTSSVKIIHPGLGSSRTCSLDYIGIEKTDPLLKSAAAPNHFFYNAGHNLLYIAYMNNKQSGIPDTPTVSKSFAFQFATKMPCPGMPTVTYMGKVYNTIQMFSQCWLKENLDVGSMISWPTFQKNNGVIEKYCYNNIPANCDTYGGLYQWNEAMQYVFTGRVQGICPPSWHIATDAEWQVLEGSIDVIYHIGSPTWDYDGWRGSNAGFNLKAYVPWNMDYNSCDPFHFSALPAGGLFNPSGYSGMGYSSSFWSSNKPSWTSNPYIRTIDGYTSTIARNTYDNSSATSVRCIRDY